MKSTLHLSNFEMISIFCKKAWFFNSEIQRSWKCPYAAPGVAVAFHCQRMAILLSQMLSLSNPLKVDLLRAFPRALCRASHASIEGLQSAVLFKLTSKSNLLGPTDLNFHWKILQWKQPSLTTDRIASRSQGSELYES